MLLTSSISFPNLGITVDPSPVAFTIFGKEIYWYGIIIACGFLLAVLYMIYRAKTFGLTQDDVLDLVLWAVPIGVVCARLYYCVFYWDLYRDNPISMLYIWEGGLAIYGGIIGGAITVLVLSRVKKIPPLVMLDNASMGVIIGQICGRWGNFMNREAHGSVTDSFFKMGLADAAGNITYYHPTFLYESVWNLVGFIGLHFYCKKRKWARVDRRPAHGQPLSVLDRHPRQPARCGGIVHRSRRRNCVRTFEEKAEAREPFCEPHP